MTLTIYVDDILRVWNDGFSRTRENFITQQNSGTQQNSTNYKKFHKLYKIL